jgi:hypothetical protein
MKKPRPPGKEGRTIVDRLARLGLFSRGVVYLLIAWIAVRIAMTGGGGGGEADRQGALQMFAHNGAGKVLLGVMTLGFAGYAAWRATEAIWGHRDEQGPTRWLKRAGSAGRAVLYGVFAWSTGRAAVVGSGGQSSNSTSKKTTAGLLGQPGGRALVIAVGVGFLVAGVVLAIRGAMRKFETHLHTEDMGKRTEAAVAAVGVAGQTARGIVFGIVAWFFVDAAVRYDPAKAQGLDGALRSLAQAPLGRAALVVVALGLAAFGLYSLAEARWRET